MSICLCFESTDGLLWKFIDTSCSWKSSNLSTEWTIRNYIKVKLCCSANAFVAYHVISRQVKRTREFNNRYITELYHQHRYQHNRIYKMVLNLQSRDMYHMVCLISNRYKLQWETLCVCVCVLGFIKSPHTEISADGIKGKGNGYNITICCGGRKHSVTLEDQVQTMQRSHQKSLKHPSYGNRCLAAPSTA